MPIGNGICYKKAPEHVIYAQCVHHIHKHLKIQSLETQDAGAALRILAYTVPKIEEKLRDFAEPTNESSDE